jgi:putative tricarboxylic transport membrane protein
MGGDRLALLSRLREATNFNTALALGCIAFSLFLFLVIPYQIERPPILFGQSAGVIDPALFPRLVAGALMLVGLWYLRVSFDLHEANGFRSLDRPAWLNLGVTTAAFVLYAAALRPTGFIVSSTILIAALALFYGARNWIAVAAVAAGVPLATYYLFTRWLAVVLPELPDF